MENINLARLLYDIIVFGFVFVLGSIWGVSIVKRNLREKSKVNTDTETSIKHVSMPAWFIRVEYVEGLMLWYNTFDNQFICQGTTLDESAKNFCTNTKNEIVGMFVVDGKKFIFHDFECLPVKE